VKLLTQSLRGRLPKLGATDGQKDPVTLVKFFTPWNSWTWYVTEFDGEDILFGLFIGFEREPGYFSLRELEAIAGPAGLRIERDLHFQPTPLSQCR